MGTTSIEWTDKTWNPTRGCSRVSDGCRHCYAERFAARFSGKGGRYEGLVKTHPSGEPRWTGDVRLVPEMLDAPLRWRKPQKIFVNSMSDLFHEKLSNEEIAAVFGVMAAAPRHTFQVLTKRPERMRAFVEAWDRGDRSTSALFGKRLPLLNVWLGVSVENQETADERIPLLLQTPAAVRFISYEPALGPVNFMRILIGQKLDQPLPRSFDRDTMAVHNEALPRLHLVIVGGESGPGARPFDVAWARSVVAQCKAAGAACFVKQLGAQPYYEGAHRQRTASEGGGIGREHNSLRLRDRKGADMAEWPEDLRVQELPEVRA